jgi:ribokinase
VSERPFVTVVGSVHSDLIASADTMPAPGTSVLGNRFTLAPGGKAGNQAAQLAKLGVPTVLISRIGTDALGNVIAGQLAAAGVNCTYLTRAEDEATGASTVFAVGGEYASIIVPGAAAGLTDDDLAAAEIAFLRSQFVLAQLELGTALVAVVISRAKASGATTVLNASPIQGVNFDDVAAILDLVDVLVVNRHEAAVLVRAPIANRADASLAAVQLNERFALKVVVITCGAEGVILARGNTIVEQAAWPIKVADTVGAGDAFLGALIAAWRRGDDDQAALSYGAAAGALAASGFGAFTSLPDRAEVYDFLGSQG